MYMIFVSAHGQVATSVKIRLDGRVMPLLLLPSKKILLNGRVNLGRRLPLRMLRIV
jgi:hypothetical protein